MIAADVARAAYTMLPWLRRVAAPALRHDLLPCARAMSAPRRYILRCLLRHYFTLPPRLRMLTLMRAAMPRFRLLFAALYQRHADIWLRFSPLCRGAMLRHARYAVAAMPRFDAPLPPCIRRATYDDTPIYINVRSRPITLALPLSPPLIYARQRFSLSPPYTLPLQPPFHARTLMRAARCRAMPPPRRV